MTEEEIVDSITETTGNSEEDEENTVPKITMSIVKHHLNFIIHYNEQSTN